MTQQNIYNNIFNAIIQYSKDKNLDINIINQYIERLKYFIPNQDKVQYPFERHHMLPASWGGTNPDNWSGSKESENLINIPIRDHILIHKLLSETYDKSMIFAFTKTCNRQDKHQKLNEYFSEEEIIDLVTDSKVKRSIILGHPVINLNTGEEFRSVTEASYSLGLYCGAVRDGIRNKCKTGGYYWQYKDVIEKSSIEEELQEYLELEKIRREKAELNHKSRCKPVTNLNTGEQYSSAEEVKKLFPGSNVGSAIAHNRKVLGCYWQYTNIVDKNGREIELQKCIEISKRRRYAAAKQNSKQLMRPIICLETRKEYESGREAAKQANVTPSAIQKAIKNRTKAGGHYWQYKDVTEKSSIDDELQKCIENTNQNRINQTTAKQKRVLCIETGQMFDSTKEASLFYSENKNGVSHAIRHNFAFCGYHWKYIESETE